jgi:hypothetical protein
MLRSRSFPPSLNDRAEEQMRRRPLSKRPPWRTRLFTPLLLEFPG